MGLMIGVSPLFLSNKWYNIAHQDGQGGGGGGGYFHVHVL